MKVYLSAVKTVLTQNLLELSPECKNYSPYFLESFAYMTEETEKMISKFRDFLLDSGAFTFRNSVKDKNIDWNKYVERYAEFIKKNDIEYFFELDIDSLIGYENVKKLRNKLEKITNKKCIPVWHFNRGKEDFLEMCDNYNYVALGGIVGSKKDKKEYQKIFPWFISEAHKKNCKIHGLGFTNTEKLRDYHFDSVDSTTWLVAEKFGELSIFKNKNMKRISMKDKRLIKVDNARLFNFNEWIKFQKYASRYL